MITGIISKVLANALILRVIANAVPQLGFNILPVGGVSIAIYLLLGGLFWLFNDVMKWLVKLVTFPISFLTFGLSSFIINIAMIYLFQYVVNYELDRGVTIALGTILQVIVLGFVVSILNLILKAIL